jgi:hypothetical protein
MNDSSASEYSEHDDPEAGGDNFSLEKRLGYDDIKEKMLHTLGHKTLKYNYKSFSIFKSIICCHILRKRSHLLKHDETRKLVLYNKGIERLDKEIDIVEMVKKFRKLDVIIKLLLKKDQQLLLDLKNCEYISSDEESERYVLGNGKKKVIKKHKLLQNYINNIKSKELSGTDIKLLKILGFNSVLEMLTRPTELAKINTNWTDVNPILMRKGTSLTKRGKSQSPKKGNGKKVMFGRNSSVDTKEDLPENIYRSKKNVERRRLKNIMRGMSTDERPVKNITESSMYHEVSIKFIIRSQYCYLYGFHSQTHHKFIFLIIYFSL